VPWTVVAGAISQGPAAWTAGNVYTAGMTAIENGVIYQAKWWTQGDDPAYHNGASGQPWAVVGPVDGAHSVPTVPTGLAAAGTTSTATILELECSERSRQRHRDRLRHLRERPPDRDRHRHQLCRDKPRG
jgi:hypothetical protein